MGLGSLFPLDELSLWGVSRSLQMLFLVQRDKGVLGLLLPPRVGRTFVN